MILESNDINSIYTISNKQLGRKVRNIITYGSLCKCGLSNTVITHPSRNNVIIPTIYYLTCKILIKEISRLESSGYMNELNLLLKDDKILFLQYRRAYRSYMNDIELYGGVPLKYNVGGMPNRIKCLHALLAHSLVMGKGINPIGDIIIEKLKYLL